jgi:hypothetical protein
MPTKSQLRCIHTGARAVRLIELDGNDARYRMLLRNAGDVESAADLDNRGVEDVMAILEDMGFDDHPGGERYWRDKVLRRRSACCERMAYKIHALATEQRYELGALCLRFSDHRTDVVEQLLPREAWNLIEMLKAVVGREAAEPSLPF